MNRVINSVSRSLLASSVFLAGIANGFGADSPKATVIGVAKALREGDTANFVAGFDATPKEVDFLAALGGFSEAAILFRNRFATTYGIDYWTALQNAKDPPGAHDFSFTHVTTKQMEELEKLDDATLRDERIVKLPNTETEQVLIEKDGQWLIDATTMLPEHQSMELATDLINKMAAIVSSYSALIGTSITTSGAPSSNCRTDRRRHPRESISQSSVIRSIARQILRRSKTTRPRTIRRLA